MRFRFSLDRACRGIPTNTKPLSQPSAMQASVQCYGWFIAATPDVARPDFSNSLSYSERQVRWAREIPHSRSPAISRKDSRYESRMRFFVMTKGVMEVHGFRYSSTIRVMFTFRCRTGKTSKRRAHSRARTLQFEFERLLVAGETAEQGLPSCGLLKPFSSTTQRTVCLSCRHL